MKGRLFPSRYLPGQIIYSVLGKILMKALWICLVFILYTIGFNTVGKREWRLGIRVWTYGETLLPKDGQETR